MNIRKILCLVLAALMVLSLVSCGKTFTSSTSGDGKTASDTKADTAEAGSADISGEHVKVAITVKDFGTMTLELYPDVAPITVQNFLTYVDEGFYNGLTFHRIYKGFMIQGGDPAGNGTGNGTHGTIKGEFAQNGVKNDISHKRGVISMARSNAPDSASCQFFICDADSTFLDGQYAAFGMLVDGEDVLDAIASTEVKVNPMTGEQSTPVTPPVIESIVRVAD